MKTAVKEYLHFRKQEPEIIERNLDVIAGANLKILKIGLAVSVVIFSTVGVFFCFYTVYRAVSYFVFSACLVGFYLLAQRIGGQRRVLLLFYAVFEFFCLFSIYLMIYQANVLAVVGVCLLSVMPTEILDRSYRVEIFSFVNTVAMCVASWLLKSSAAISVMDTFHFAGAFLIGVSVGAHTRVSNFELFELQRKTNSQRYYDFLTGLANRRKLFDDLQGTENRDCRSLSAVMIDVDYFKQYNDIYGYQNGDFILKRIACVLSEEGGKNDIVFYRYGGEEFIGVCDSRKADVGTICGNIRAKIETLDIPFTESPFGKVTVSVGFVENYTDGSESSDEIIRMADSALYSAKRRGRNRVERFEKETDCLKPASTADTDAEV